MKKRLGEQVTATLEPVNILDRIIAETKLTPQDVADLPYEDVLFLVEIATRQRDLDALGEHLAGLPVAKDWETFREGIGGDAALADL